MNGRSGYGGGATSRSCLVLVAGMTMAATACAHGPATPADAQVPRSSRDVELPTATGTLHGTLLHPASAEAAAAGHERNGVPVVLIIPGSGPTDRDGNSAMLAGPNNSLLMLAEGLAERGIASLRIDKRGIAASAMPGRSEEDLNFRHYVDDVVGWVQWLRSDAGYGRVFVAGHSEGALVAILAAHETPLDGVISIAGMGRTMAATVRTQLAAQLPPPMLARVDTIIDGIRTGQTVEVPPMLAALFRPSVQPYLRSVMDIDPAAELARLNVPVLIAQGTTDVQVSVAEDAERLRAAAPRASYLVVDGMNHVLKHVSGPLAQQIPSYSDPSLPIAQELVDAVVAFVRR